MQDHNIFGFEFDPSYAHPRSPPYKNIASTPAGMIILMVSDSLKYNVAFFFDFKQLPRAKNVEILSSLLTESEKRKI